MTDRSHLAQPEPLPFRGGVGGGDSPRVPASGVEDDTSLPTPTPPLKGRGFRASDYDKRLGTAPSHGRGQDWGPSALQLAELHARARHMRNNPTEPEKRLWRNLSNSQLQGHKFRRQEVIGWHIADFMCPKSALIVEVDGMTHDFESDRKRDAILGRRGYRVVHVTNEEVMHNMDGVLTLILCVLGEASACADSPHPNPSPEGEGL